MSFLVTEALWAFTQRYVQAWEDQHNSLPMNADLVGVASPCIEKTLDLQVVWKPIKRDKPMRLVNTEQGIELDLHDDFHAFYGSQFCADMPANFEGLNLELLQVWSEEDMERLQENILAHLVMQRRLKLLPTLFIGVTEDDMEVIAICNQSGEIILEQVGTKKRQVLAENLNQFLNALTPSVV